MARRDVRQGAGLVRRPGLTPALLLALAFDVALAGAAAGAPVENRWHYVWRAGPELELSVLFRRGEEGDTTRLLVASAAGRFDLVSKQGPTGRSSEEAIVDTATGERLSRTLVLPPDRFKEGCPQAEEKDGCVVFTSRKGRVAAPLSAFVPGAGGDRLRASVRGLVSPAFAARLAELAAIFPKSADFDRYGGDFVSLAWPGLVPKRPTKVEAGEPAPGCAFEAAFGYPCGERERKWERRRFGPDAKR